MNVPYCHLINSVCNCSLVAIWKWHKIKWITLQLGTIKLLCSNDSLGCLSGLYGASLGWRIGEPPGHPGGDPWGGSLKGRLGYLWNNQYTGADQDGPSGRGHNRPTLSSGGINMMSGGIGAPLAAVCMTHRCVDTLCYSVTPLPAMGQIVRWTRLVSWVKAAGLGDGYSEIKTKLWRWSFKEASPPHWPADRGLTTHFGATMLLLKRAPRTFGILMSTWPDDDVAMV